MHETVQERLERAHDASFEYFIKHDDPHVIEIESGDSTYTIVPNVSYCSCPDRQYRHNPCKHLLYLGVRDGVPPDVARSILSGFEYRLDTLVDLARKGDVDASALDVWIAALQAVDDAFPPLPERDGTAPERAPDNTGRAKVIGTDSGGSEPETDEIGRIASTVSN